MTRKVLCVLAVALLLVPWASRGELLIDPADGTVLFDSTKGADDEVSAGRLLTFPFAYFGDAENPLEQVDVSVNGNLNFSNDSEFTNEAMPSPDIARISGLWDDLEVTAGSTDAIVEKVNPGVWYSVTWTVHGTKLGARHVFQIVLFGKQVQIGKVIFQPNDVVLAYREIGASFEKNSATLGLDAGEGDRFATAPGLVDAGGILESGNGPSILALSSGMLLFRPNEEGGYDLPTLANRPPLAADDSGYTLNGTQTLRLPVLTNDADEDGNTLTVTGITQGSTGTVTLLEGGNVSYTPGSNYAGRDEFTYTVEDGLGGSATGKVEISSFDSASGSYEGTWTDADQEPLGRLQLLVDDTGQFTGTLALEGDKKTPFTGTFDQAGHFAGGAGDPDSSSVFDLVLDLEFHNGVHRVTGTVDDGSGPASLLAPLGGNNPPVAHDTLAYLRGAAKLIVPVLPLTSDQDGDPLHVSVVTQGTAGSVAINADGTLTYIPARRIAGVDRFSYTVTDPQGLTATGHVTVLPFAQAPGSYEGLVQLADDEGLLLPENSGRLRVNLAGGGHFTAVLWYGGRRQQLTGVLDSAGRFQIDLPGDPTLHVELALDLTNDSQQVTGTVSDGENVSQITAGKSRYWAKSFPAPQAGAYTILLEPDETDAPAGVGFARLKISPAGRARFVGKLGDGKAFMLSAPLLVDGTIPFYLPRPIKQSSQAGFLAGTLAFKATLVGSDLGGSILWTHPDVEGSDVPGFTAYVAVSGARYVPPAAGQPVLNLSLQHDNATVLLDDEPLSVTIGADERVTITDSGDLHLMLRLQPGSGIFTGSFQEETTDPVTGDPQMVLRKFSGALVPRQQRGAGVIPQGENGPRSVRIEKPATAQ